MSEQLDIFQTLNELNKKNYDYYSSLTEKERKSIAPLVLMRWMSGAAVNKEQFVIGTNEFVNPYVFSLHKHPELLWKLLCVCSTGKFTKYNWTKKSNSTKPTVLKTIKEYYKYSTKEALLVINSIKLDDILYMAEFLGYETADITKIKKEMQ